MHGGVDGNERLTASNAVVLLVLLALEGATLFSVGQLLVPHVFIGFLLIPPVALKLASTGWRMLSYYGGRRDYVQRGPPHPFVRFVIAPAVVVSTIALFASGVAVVATGRHGLLLGLHKASFVIWLGATTIHVLAYVLRLPGLVGADLRRSDRLPGVRLRQGALAAAVVGGATLAVWALPYAHQWHSWMFG
jgi:hypothetical protein